MNTSTILLRRCSRISVNCLWTFSKLRGVRKSNITSSRTTLQNSATVGCMHNVGRQFSSVAETDSRLPLCESSDKDAEDVVTKNFKVIKNFINEEEEKSMLKEAETYLKRLRYEYDHWDNAIHGYRETEKSRWNDTNKAVLQRVRDAAFEPGVPQLVLVHVLDLAKDGYIKPHVDSVKFCGSTVTGLSLLSSSIMRLANEKDPKQWVNILLEPRSLYIMTGQARYDFTHEILKQEESIFHGKVIPRDRRISIMCRNEPT
ncbi:alpha-ketoglutarate-dependent dioxygenase alkB homolog 7, mitochondrial-like isoform X2 [Amphiura filiformis]|uniref:alpha-ketoglutarate-dependent dioxygenase alkB homolog 7, mitochondrial-like isoform X1 n=1 Tax=Amphiura filiformis TaxID=82378 RepID=UPI003B225872